MDATENLNSAAPVQRPWMRRVALALAYVIVWVMLWHTANVFNRMTGFDLWIPCAGLTFALLLDYGGRALPLPLLAALLAGWPAWSGEHWPYGLAAILGPLPGYLIAAYILRHRSGGKGARAWRFDDPRRVAAFLGAAALGALFAALVDAPLSQAAGWAPPGLSWLEMVGRSWVGHFIGIATLAPLALLFIAPVTHRWGRGESWRLPNVVPAVEPPPIRLGLLQGSLSAALLGVLFWTPHPQWLGQPYPFITLLLLPVLTWIAATYGARGTAPAVLLYQLGIVALAAEAGRPDLTLQYQMAMAAIAASGLLTGAVSSARLTDMARFRDLAEVSNDLLWEFDDQGRLYDLRGHFSRTMGAFNGQLGKNWQEYVIQQESDTGLATLRAALRKRQRFQQVVLCVRLPGRKAPIWTRNSGLPLFDDSGEFRGYRGTTTDISDYQRAEAERQRAETRLQDYDRNLEVQVEARVVERTRMLTEVSLRNWRLANFDSLTELPNRNLFFEHLGKSLQQARRQWRMLALLLVDLDGFKEVNDTFGHEMGDELLRQVAARLRQCIRATDTAARLGGDEFTIVLTDLEQADAADAVARKLVAHLAEPVLLGEITANVTASIGIALYRPEWPANLDMGMALLRRADAAMYEAKRAGKNDWRFAEPRELEAAS
jgi:diguanylate cyclase (GGDEF)-like protein/PAS domain S-box-containing protein